MKKIAIISLCVVLFCSNVYGQEIAVRAGGTFIDNGIQPMIGVSYGDQIGYSETFSFELAASGLMREYSSTAISAGKKYLALRTEAILKAAVWQRRKVASIGTDIRDVNNQTVNLIAGFGYEFTKDDYSLVYGNTQASGAYSEVYQGYTPVVTFGAEYRFTMKNRNSIAAKATLDYGQSVVACTVCERTLGGTLGIAYCFALK